MKQIKPNILYCRVAEKSMKNFHVHYDTIYLAEYKIKESLGEDYKCRFCGTTHRKKFKLNNAHAIPSFTGNKWLFSKRECTDCNQILSEYEGELANHGTFNRTMLGMKFGNGKGPKYKNDLFSIQNIDGKLNFKIDKNEDKTKFESILNIKSNFETDEHHLEFTPPKSNYISSYLFKALAKIALTLMPDNEFENIDLEKFQKWILNKDIEFTSEGYESPVYIVFHNNFGLRELKPLAIISKKNNRYSDFKGPEYSFLFGFAGLIYQIYIPYVKMDAKIHSTGDTDLLVIPEIIKVKNDKANFIMLNGSNSIRTDEPPESLEIN